MEYKGKLYGKVGKSYFPLQVTTDDYDALNKRLSELEAENRALKISSNSFVIGSLPTSCQYRNSTNMTEACPNKNVCEYCRQ